VRIRATHSLKSFCRSLTHSPLSERRLSVCGKSAHARSTFTRFKIPRQSECCSDLNQHEAELLLQKDR